MVCSKKRDDHENTEDAALEAIDRCRKTLAQSGQDGIRTYIDYDYYKQPID